MNLLVLPILLPLVTAALTLLCWRSVPAQRWISSLGATALLAAAILLFIEVRQNGVIATQLGNWPAPFGITLVADLFSAVMVVMAGLIGWVAAIYSLGSVDRQREETGYYPFVHFLLMGVCGVFLTGDLFNLYVWFEVMLMASFVLMALGGDRFQMEGAFKYVVLNLISSVFFLAGIGIIYGLTGTLNLADLAQQLPLLENSALVTTLAMLFITTFGIKAGIFPLFFWLPASYHTPPVAVTALFAGLLTKVGVYALIRVFTLLFVGDLGYTHTILLVLGGLTMVTGVLGAVAQEEVRRLLSFHIISQIGYMVMGLGLYSHLALAGAIFFLVHNILVKTSLFLVSGIARYYGGSYRLDQLGGLYRWAPFLSLLFLLAALSLAGIPPLSGFWGKLMLIRAGLEQQAWLPVATALGVGLLTLFSMTKIWMRAFWPARAIIHPPLQPIDCAELRWPLYAPLVLLVSLSLVMGLLPQAALEVAFTAAAQLMDPAEYIRVVSGEGP
ncbi:Na+/H+ antiporter subunit D [Desulfurivibrio sp. D14AmB]|uniref:Na+/H+ antiporter subunit D n=1 Tax=Desulfurivibrio sp. D14AmB TaxID=3374370 RepID=UPI00376EF10E